MLGFLKKLFGGGASEELTNKIQNAGTIVDVRTIGEFKGGHLKGSVNIPLSDLAKKQKAFQKMKQPIIVVCKSGMRAGSATSQLKSWGLEAYNGGGWTSAQQIINNK